jgi:CDP-diacylglycerol--glycerol-3-phosphate 3-phosphatidyltransferase
MIPLFLVIVLVDIPALNYQIPFIGASLYRWIAAVVFLAAAVTDFLDGYIARKRNLVTDLGKFLDPLSDKLLVMAAMVYLVGIGELASWIVIIILSREFIITGFRTIAAGRGLVMAADIWGKVKTVFQIITVMYILVEMTRIDALLNEYFDIINIFSILRVMLIAATVGITVISGTEYIRKNIRVFKDEKK